MKQIISILLLSCAAASAQPIIRNYYTTNDTPNLSPAGSNTVNNIIGNAVGTNFVLLSATANDSIAALNDASRPATVSKALQLLRTTPAAWSNGVIINPPGTSIIVTNDGVLGQCQTVTVVNVGAEIASLTEAFPFTIWSNQSCLTIIGGKLATYVDNQNGGAIGIGAGSTNALVRTIGIEGYGTQDFIHKDVDSPLGAQMRNVWHWRDYDSRFSGKWDISFVGPQHAGTNYTVELHRSSFRTDGEQNASYVPTAITASAGIWTFDNVTGFATNGVAAAIGLHAYNGCRATFIGQNYFAGGSTNALCTTPWGIHAENSTLDFSQSDVPNHNGFLTNFQSTIIYPSKTFSNVTANTFINSAGALTSSVTVLSTSTTNVTLTTNYSGGVRHYAITASSGGGGSSGPTGLTTNTLVLSDMSGCNAVNNGNQLFLQSGQWDSPDRKAWLDISAAPAEYVLYVWNGEAGGDYPNNARYTNNTLVSPSTFVLDTEAAPCDPPLTPGVDIAIVTASTTIKYDGFGVTNLNPAEVVAALNASTDPVIVPTMVVSNLYGSMGNLSNQLAHANVADEVVDVDEGITNLLNPSLTIPANTLKPGDVIHMTMIGRYDNPTILPSDLVLSHVYGDKEAAVFVSYDTSALGEVLMEVNTYATVRTIGNPGTIMASSSAVIDEIVSRVMTTELLTLGTHTNIAVRLDATVNGDGVVDDQTFTVTQVFVKILRR